MKTITNHILDSHKNRISLIGTFAIVVRGVIFYNARGLANKN